MAATMGFDFSRSSTGHSPDISSPQYPDRPIRPLPKRRIRSRLSPEQAKTIVFPPAPPTSSTLFGTPYNTFDKLPPIRPRYSDDHSCNCGGHHSEIESDEDEEDRIRAAQASPSLLQFTRNILSTRSEAGPAMVPKPPPPDSGSSSADGYESFENTNNKKKRKIPVCANAGSHQTALAAELANMGIGTQSGAKAHDDERNGATQYHGSGSSANVMHGKAAGTGTGISGAGRGRYGRSSARSSGERRPLGASTNGLNAYACGSSQREKREWSGGAGVNGRGSQPADQGIISAAIASAAEQPVTPQKGKENISLLQQHSSGSTPQKTQFTFTCDSDTSSKMAWPVQNGPSSTPLPNSSNMPAAPTNQAGPANGRVMSTPRTQNYPNMNGPQQRFTPTTREEAAAVPNNQQPQQSAPAKKSRPRRPGRIYALAARQRRLQQEYNNFHHPPSRDEIWICEFCEYESIFGSPPEALVRDYEIKDRKERKRLAEKRRLLEKAKMKGRKGKKGGKGTNRNAPAAGAQQNPPQNGTGPQTDYYEPMEPHGSDYFDDEFDDGAMSAPAPTPAPTPNHVEGPGGLLDEHMVKSGMPVGGAATHGGSVSAKGRAAQL